MRPRRIARAAVAALLLLLLAAPPLESSAQQAAATAAHTHGAQSKAIDLGNFVKELMVLKMENGAQHLALWFPYEFFVATAMADGKSTRAAIEPEVAFLKPYVTIAVQANRDLPDGTTLYQKESEIRARAALRLEDGTEIAPLAKAPPTLAEPLAAMKSLISQQGGQDGANTFFLVFPNQTGTGKLAVNERQKDKLMLVLKADRNFRETAFTWRTPFDAVTSVPDCPKCKAGLSAKWVHCPYCGQKISN